MMATLQTIESANRSHLEQAIQPQTTPPHLSFNKRPYPNDADANIDITSNDENEEWRADQRWRNMTLTIAHYQRLMQIGEGTYGQVYKAKCLNSGRDVALKKIRVQHGAYQGFPTTAIREIKIMKKLSHFNMVELIEVLTSKGVEYLDHDDEREEDRRKREKDELTQAKDKLLGQADGRSESVEKQAKSLSTNNKDKHIDTREGFKGNLFLVLEYVSHDLTGLMDMHYRFSEVQVKCIFRQLLDVLDYIHENKYVHRDLKCSNILLTSHFELKLADFGLARSIDDTHCMFDSPGSSANVVSRASHFKQDFTNKVITLWYRPPELLLGETQYGTAVDMWSAGCILAEIILGKPILTGKTEMEQLSLIFDLMGTPSEETWAGYQDLKHLKSGEMSVGKSRKSQLSKKYERKGKMCSSAIGLLEKLLELDPSKRITAERALTSRYFLEEPRAPENPAHLGTIDLGSGAGADGHFHEFQTKKKRREAKAAAEKSKKEAIANGLNSKEAEKVYNDKYEAEIRRMCEEESKQVTKDNQKNISELKSRAYDVDRQVECETQMPKYARDKSMTMPAEKGLESDGMITRRANVDYCAEYANEDAKEIYTSSSNICGANSPLNTQDTKDVNQSRVKSDETQLRVSRSSDAIAKIDFQGELGDLRLLETTESLLQNETSSNNIESNSNKRNTRNNESRFPSFDSKAMFPTDKYRKRSRSNDHTAPPRSENIKSRREEQRSGNAEGENNHGDQHFGRFPEHDSLFAMSDQNEAQIKNGRSTYHGASVSHNKGASKDFGSGQAYVTRSSVMLGKDNHRKELNEVTERSVRSRSQSVGFQRKSSSREQKIRLCDSESSRDRIETRPHTQLDDAHAGIGGNHKHSYELDTANKDQNKSKATCREKLSSPTTNGGKTESSRGNTTSRQKRRRSSKGSLSRRRSYSDSSSYSSSSSSSSYASSSSSEDSSESPTVRRTSSGQRHTRSRSPRRSRDPERKTSVNNQRWDLFPISQHANSGFHGLRDDLYRRDGQRRGAFDSDNRGRGEFASRLPARGEAARAGRPQGYGESMPTLIDQRGLDRHIAGPMRAGPTWRNDRRPIGPERYSDLPNMHDRNALRNRHVPVNNERRDFPSDRYASDRSRDRPNQGINMERSSRYDPDVVRPNNVRAPKDREGNHGSGDFRRPELKR